MTPENWSPAIGDFPEAAVALAWELEWAPLQAAVKALARWRMARWARIAANADSPPAALPKPAATHSKSVNDFVDPCLDLVT